MAKMKKTGLMAEQDTMSIKDELWSELMEVCKKKKFSKSDFAVYSFLPCSKDAYNTYGDLNIAFEEAIKTANEYDDVDTIIAEYCEKIGV